MSSRRPLLALLTNAGAGNGEADSIEHTLGRLGANVAVFAFDDRAGVAAAAPDRVVVAGGDGTVATGALAAATAGVPLAVVPVGTANDFARSLSIPDDVEQACELALRGSRTRRLELGRVGERPFVNVASAGLSPVAAERADGLKRLLGPPAYAIGALCAGLGAKPVRCRVTCDGAPFFSGAAWQVSVAVTGAFGGGSDVEADPEDGRLDVVVIEAGPRLRLLVHAYGLRSGRVEAQAGVDSRRARRVVIDGEGALGFNVDGELIELGQAHFRVEPNAFEVVHG